MFVVTAGELFSSITNVFSEDYLGY